MRKRIGWILAGVLTVSVPALAQQEEGDKELQIQGTLTLATSGDTEHSGSVFVNFGKFFTLRQEAGLTLIGTFQEDGDLAGFGGPFYRFNFSAGRTAPFVGASAAAAFGTSGFGEGVLIGLEGGVRHYLSRRAAFSVAGQSGYSVDDQEFSDSLNVVFGFSILWGK
jgi:hypothetical protein